MPRGRKLGTKSKKSTKSASKSAEQNARSVSMSRELSQLSQNTKNLAKTYDIKSIKTARELLDALAAKETKIALGDNIITDTNILINHDLEIDFNNFSIISEEHTAAARVLDIRSGRVKLSGTGKVFAMGARSVAMRVFGAISAGVPHYTDVEIGGGISLYAPDNYGILISPNLGVAYGVSVKFAGKIMAHDGICIASGVHGDMQNCPQIIIDDHAQIIADELTGAALEASGYGDWKIAKAQLSGAFGAVMRTGALDFKNAQIWAHAAEVFRIEDGAERELGIKVDGGIYLSEQSAIFGGISEPVKKITLTGCELYSPLEEAIIPEIEACAILKDCELETDLAAGRASLDQQSTSLEVKPQEQTEVETEVATQETPSIMQDNTTENLDDTPVEQVSKFEMLSEDDLVDELFDFADDLDNLDDENFNFVDTKEPKMAPIEELAMDVQTEEELEDLKPAPKFAQLAEEIQENPDFRKPAVEKSTEKTQRAQKTKTAAKKTRKSRKKSQNVVQPTSFMASLDLVPELTDAETDEQEILLALNDDNLDLQPPVPEITHPPMPALVDEQAAAKIALQDAIMEIRKLSAEDYDLGFSQLEQALQKAERILARPQVGLAAIRDAAAELLQAFDMLEEHDDAALSDAELDELFYQGAVLEEMLRPQKKAPEVNPTSPKINANSDSALVQTEITKVASGARKPENAKTPQTLEPDFEVLSETLTTISTLDLSKYTAASQAALLTELNRAQTVLTNLQSSQAEIDEVATKLLAQMSRLEVQSAKHATQLITAKTTTPAPIINAILPATMIDELSPASTWSIGVTMIDELTPFVTDLTTREKMLRAMRPHFELILEALTNPFRKLARSLAAGIKAGLRAYRDTLHANKI